MKLLDRLLGRKPKQETKTKSSYSKAHKKYYESHKSDEHYKEMNRLRMRAYRLNLKQNKLPKPDEKLRSEYISY